MPSFIYFFLSDRPTFCILSSILSFGEMCPMSWKPVESVVRSRMPLVHLDVEALSEMTENAQSTATNQAPSSCRAESCFVLIELEG